MLRLNRFVLRVLGLWPEEKYSSLAQLRLGLSIFSLSSLVLAQIYSIQLHWGDIAYLAENGNLTVPFALMLLKTFYVIVNRREFTRIYEWLKYFWNASDDNDERENYESYARIGRRVCALAFLCCLANLTIIVGAAATIELTNRPRHGANETRHRRLLPIDLIYGFDYENTPVFACLFVSQTIGLLAGCFLAIANDGSVLVIILHIIGQFRLINFQFHAIGRRLDAARYRQAVQSSNVNYELLDIKRYVKHHQVVVSVADSVSELISPMVFGQLITSGLQICISGYAIIDGSAKGVVLIRCSILFAAMIVQLMMWCVPGDLLDQESGAVATSVFQGLPWATLPASLQRDLLFVMLRAQRTCKIVAFHQVTNISKLTEIFKAAGSYMALLRSFKQ